MPYTFGANDPAVQAILNSLMSGQTSFTGVMKDDGSIICQNGNEDLESFFRSLNEESEYEARSATQSRYCFNPGELICVINRLPGGANITMEQKRGHGAVLKEGDIEIADVGYTGVDFHDDYRGTMQEMADDFSKFQGIVTGMVPSLSISPKNDEQLEATAKLVIENLARLKQVAALYAQVEAMRKKFMKRVEIINE